MHDSSYGWDAALAARSVHGHRAPDDAAQGMPPQGLREAWDAAQPIADRSRKPLSAWPLYGDAERALPPLRARACETRGC